MNKNIAKNLRKTYGVSRVKIFLIMLENLLQMHLKVPQKKNCKKHQKQVATRLIVKSLTKLQRIYHKLQNTSEAHWQAEQKLM